MATALSFLSSALLAPVQAVVLFFAPHAAVVRAASTCSLPLNTSPGTSPNLPLSTPFQTLSNPASNMPRNGPFNTLPHGLSLQEVSGVVPNHSLRVLRVSEPGSPAGCAGRMRMSGRFADVCAELERLAAQDMRTA